MLTTFTNTIGRQAMDIDQGQLLGWVEGLIVDPARQVVSAAVLSDRRAIRLNAIHSFGQRAIMVDPNKLNDTTENRQFVDQFESEGPILDKRVVAEGGEEVGALEDIVFDCFTGELHLLVISGGVLEKLAHGNALLRAESSNPSRPIR
jgi:uncharacterized protein YrrD